MAGRMDNRQRAGWRVGIAIVAALALLGSDLVAFALPARAASTAPSGPAPEPSVAGRPVPKVEPVVGAEDTARATPPRPAPSWPAAGAAEVDLSDPGGVRQAGSLPVRVGRAAASRMGAPARVRVEVLDADAVSSLGGVGLAARVSRVDGVTTAARARVVLDYSGFAGAFDASFADRLRVVRLPGCVLDGAPKAADGCPLRTERVAAVNDFAAGTLTVDTDVTSTNTAVLMVESSSSGSFSGNFGATDLQASGRWQVGLSAGAFSYSYPVPEPPSVAGTGPSLSFGYNSAAVDGMTAASNAQSGWTGLGWTMGPGFIERRYKPCADDATGTGKKADQKNWGHLCWESPDENDGQVETTDPTNSDLTLSMEGRSSKIVKDRLTGGWKTEEDFGWRIEYLTGGASGQPYWRVTTQNGDVHRFGYRRDSEWQVPYAGDDPGEPCNSQYNSGGTTWPGMCQAPWRWNLDQVVDANENVTTLYWKREASQYRWYAREICCSVPPSYESVPISYDRGGYLDYVEWGANTAVAGSLPTSKMVFNMVSRCSDTTTRDDPLTNPYPIDTGTGNLTCKALLPPYVFWDVPNDLMTCTTTKCPSGSPAFFIVRRLDSIVTYSYDPTNAGWDDVSKLQLRFKYVQSPDNGSNGCCTPALWLDYVRPVGLAGTGEIRLPPTSFDAIALNGRVDYGSDGFFTAPRAILPRIGWVHNGFGGRVDITYGRANPCPDGGVSAAGYSTWYNSVQWDRGTDDCFRTYDFWFPGSFGSPATVHYGVYHKYLVTQVVSRDVVAGSPDMVTSYEYLNKPAWAFPTGYLGTKLTIPSNDTGGTQVIEAATWNESRGYPNVRRLTGSGTDPTGYTVDTHSFLRGMYDDKYADGTLKRTTVTDFDGNAVDDRRWLAGQELENRSWKMTTYSSDPAQRQYTELEAVRHEFARQVTGDGPGVLDPSVVNPVRSRARETLADGSYRYTDSRTGYDAFGLPITRNDYGQDGLADNTCTRTTYVRNTALWMMSYPATTEEHAGDDCTNGTVIGRTTNLYDGGTDPATNQPTNGNITESRSWTDATHVSVTKGSFDNYGRMRSGTDALGKTTTTTYSPAVNWPVNGVVMTNPLGQQATTWPNRLHGGATEVIDPDGKMTEVDYDALGRTTAVWGPADPRSGGTPSATMTYTTTYDGGIGQPTAPAKTTTQTLQSGTGGTAKWFATYAFDDGWGRDRETQTASPSGGRIVTAAAYDARGLTNVTSEPVHNGSTPGSGLLNPAATDLPSWTKHIHDGAERATATAEESYATELRRTSYVQAGADLQSVVPPAGGATDYVSDAGDRVTKAVEWVYWGVSQTTLFEYDLDGNLTKITDANGNVRTFQYDWAGRRIASHDPDAGDSTYTYDAGGQLLSTVDGRGQKISNSYDDLGRITAVWSGDADTGTKLVERRYDTIAKGQLTSATSFVGGNAYTDEILAYDENHRPTSTRLTIPGSEGLLAGTYTFTAAYDKAGHQTETGMPAAGGLAAEKVTASFTGLGYADRLTSDYGGLSIYVNSSTYSKTGRLTERRYGSRGQVKRNLAWDDATNRLTNVATLANADTATPVKAQDDDFYYDAADNIVRITDKTTTVGGVLTPQSECFNYDTRNRLIFAWTTTQADCSAGWWYSPDWKGPDPYWRAFTYDSVGNITSQDTAGHKGDYTYPTPGASSTRPNAVSKVTWPERTDTYTYGPAGELASRNVAGKTTTFDWDPLGRLSRAVTDGQATDNVYDADGDRLIRRDPGRTTLYLGQMELVLAGGQVTARRYYTAGDGATVAVRTAGTLTWLLADPQRSEQIAIDNATGHVDRQRYLPFGARRGGRDDITVTQRGYLGKTEDDATGLISLDARFYDPTIGKFTSPDALLDLRMPEWSNPYAYAGNNPTTFSDPHGLRLLCGTGDEPACPKKKPKPPKKKKPTFRCPTERCADDRIEAACDKACHKKRDAATKKAIESYKATHFKCPTERCADDRIEAACDKACHDARDKATKDAVDDIKRYKKEEAEKKEGGFWDKLTSNPIWKAAKVGLSMAAFVCQVCGLVAAGMSIVDMAVKASHGDVVGALIEGAGYFGGVVGPMAKIVAQGAKAASKGLGNISRAAKGINWKGETWRNAAGRKVAGWVGTKTANGAARAGRVERRADVTADVADVTGHYAAVGASIRDTVNENGE